MCISIWYIKSFWKWYRTFILQHVECMTLIMGFWCWIVAKLCSFPRHRALIVGVKLPTLHVFFNHFVSGLTITCWLYRLGRLAKSLELLLSWATLFQAPMIPIQHKLFYPKSSWVANQTCKWLPWPSNLYIVSTVIIDGIRDTNVKDHLLVWMGPSFNCLLNVIDLTFDASSVVKFV